MKLILIFLISLSAISSETAKLKIKPGKYKFDLTIFENGKESQMFTQMKAMLKSMPAEQRAQMLKMGKSMAKTDINLDQLMNETFCHKKDLESSLSQFGLKKEGCTQKITLNTKELLKGSFDCKEKGKGSFLYQSANEKSFKADVDFIDPESKKIKVKIQGHWVSENCK